MVEQRTFNPWVAGSSPAGPTSSAHLERGVPERGDLLSFNAGHPRRARALVHPREKILDGLLRALDLGLHPAIGQVAHPPSEPGPLRTRTDVRAIADSLHLSADADAIPLHCSSARGRFVLALLSTSRSSGHARAKPGCSTRDATSGTGTQSSSRLSGSVIWGENGSTTRATTVGYRQYPTSKTWVVNVRTAPAGTPASSLASRSAASPGASPECNAPPGIPHVPP